jgi:hypothetical protein
VLGFADIIPEPQTLSIRDMIRPMKAALQLDSAEGLGEWRVFLAARAKKNLREKLKKEPELYHIIRKKIEYVVLQRFIF